MEVNHENKSDALKVHFLKKFKQRPKGAWSMIKGVIGNEKTTLRVEVRSEHFSKIYSKPDTSVEGLFEKVVGINISDEPFTLQELVAALSKMARGKATCSDEIPLEVLCYGET